MTHFEPRSESAPPETLADPIMQEIHTWVTTRPIMLFMKGQPDFPQCGFSATAVRLLRAAGVAFDFVDVLARPDIRAALPQFANWPTFPQLYVNGELIGGADIMQSLAQSGELQTILKAPPPTV